jgi:hypothetical protein
VSRNRTSAKKAGASFERLIADHLALVLDNEHIDRRVKRGVKDRGDISGVRTTGGQRVVIEAKNVAKLDLPGWTREAQLEAGNDDALVGVVVHKRHGNGQPGEQWVTCTVSDLVRLLTGERTPDETEDVA